MGGCAALNCTNHSRHGCRMARIPLNKERRKKWLINMRRYEWQPGQSAQICFGHFEDSQFVIKRGKCVLKSCAVPTLFDFHSKSGSSLNKKQLKKTKHFKPSSIHQKIKTEKPLDDSLAPGNAHVVRIVPIKSENEGESDSSMYKEEEENDPLLEEKVDEKTPKTEFVTYFVCNSNQQITNLSQDLCMVLTNNNIVQNNPVMPENIQESKIENQSELLHKISLLESNLAKYREQQEKDQKEIKSLMQAQHHNAKTIAALEESVNVLKNQQYAHTKLEVVKKISPLLELLGNEEHKNGDETVSRKYSSEVKEFVKSLYSISPDAYKYVRDYSNMTLPSEEFVLEWLHKKNSELNVCVKEESNLSDSPSDCVEI